MDQMCTQYMCVDRTSLFLKVKFAFSLENDDKANNDASNIQII